MNGLRRRCLLAIGVAVALLTAGVASFGVVPGVQAQLSFPTQRDALTWPFAWSSIWNMPRGANATLLPAGLGAPTAYGMTVEEDIIVMEPDAPLRTAYVNTAGWNSRLTRCGTVTNTVWGPQLPIPMDFHTDPGYWGVTPNHAGAVLLADGQTVFQTQPLHVCANNTVTSQYWQVNDNIITGNGILGAHGGSGLSSLGGTIRVGELVPGGAIHHALKININCAKYCYYARNEPDGKPGYRWPAIKADTGAQRSYRGKVPGVQTGSLLALPADFDMTGLSEEARIIARAMIDYGTYMVDNTGWDVYAIATEWGPNGRVIDEFEAQFGHTFESSAVSTCTNTANADCLWAKEMARLFTGLRLVDNNAPATIGGTGARLAPCAPPFLDGSGGAPLTCAGGGSFAAQAASETSEVAGEASGLTVGADVDAAPALRPEVDVLTITEGIPDGVRPLDGTRVPAGAPLTVTLIPSKPTISRVEFFIDDPETAGAPALVDARAPYTLGSEGSHDLGRLEPGVHTVTVVRTTAAGVRFTTTATFSVGPAPDGG